jgi:hypothetical protein
MLTPFHRNPFSSFGVKIHGRTEGQTDTTWTFCVHFMQILRRTYNKNHYRFANWQPSYLRQWINTNHSVKQRGWRKAPYHSKFSSHTYKWLYIVRFQFMWETSAVQTGINTIFYGFRFIRKLCHILQAYYFPMHCFYFMYCAWFSAS